MGDIPNIYQPFKTKVIGCLSARQRLDWRSHFSREMALLYRDFLRNLQHTSRNLLLHTLLSSSELCKKKMLERRMFTKSRRCICVQNLFFGEEERRKALRFREFVVQVTQGMRSWHELRPKHAHPRYFLPSHCLGLMGAFRVFILQPPKL